MLGETPLPAQARSIFDYMSQKDRERLEKIKEDLSTPCPPSSPPIEPPSTYVKGEVIIPQLHPSIAKAALSGFQPFTADPIKHSRYTAFLQYTSQDTSGKQISVRPLPGQSIDEFNKELSDYAKSATVFKPLSGAMASRFKSAVIVEMGPKVIEGLHTPAQDVNKDGEGGAEKEEEKDEDPRMAAVKLGMYGPLTRQVTPWQPARLLCKRFGVKEPELDPEDVAKPEAKDTGIPEPDAAPAAAPLAITDGPAAEVSKPGVRNLASIGLGDDETQGQDTLTYQRPAMDIFKAIFASDDEESDEEDEDVAADPVQEPAEHPAAPPAGNTQVAVKAEPTTVLVPSPPNEVEEKVDLTTFKPVFIPRSDRDVRKDKDREKDRDKKKKKAKTTLVSFDDGEEDGGLQVSVAAAKSEKRKKDKDRDEERRKKKQRKEEKHVKKEEQEDDDSMWIEKPAPEVAQKIAFDNVQSDVSSESGPDGVAGPPRGRKRAVDFM